MADVDMTVGVAAHLVAAIEQVLPDWWSRSTVAGHWWAQAPDGAERVGVKLLDGIFGEQLVEVYAMSGSTAVTVRMPVRVPDSHVTRTVDMLRIGPLSDMR